MFVYKQLRVTFDYSKENDHHNHDLVAYVIQKYPRKIVRTAILTRDSVHSWYEDVKDKFPRSTHVILIGTISLLGEIDSIQNDDNRGDNSGDDEKKSYFHPSATKPDPSAN